MREIRIHGRGGQGAVTAAQLLASAAFEEGKQVQSFAMFGMERRGAPVTAFTRIDSKPIVTREIIQNPDSLILLDPSMVKFPSTFSGLKAGGIVVMNSNRSVAELKKATGAELKKATGKLEADIFPIDATKISVNIFGQSSIPFTNVVMISAFAGVTKIVQIKSILKILPDFFSAKIVDKNKKAGLEGYKMMRNFLEEVVE